MEEKNEEVEDVGSASGDSFIDESEDDGPSTSGQDEQLHLEEPLTEQEIEDLVAEFLEVESKAAEAQEALEKESLTKVENEVRGELALTLNGDDLETAVANEMSIFTEEWEGALDELEIESAHLLSTFSTCWNSMDGKSEKSRALMKNLSACDVEALRKCLQENNGDCMKCESQIQAFNSSCSLKKPNSSLQSGRDLRLVFDFCRYSVLLSNSKSHLFEIGAMEKFA